MKPKHFYLVSCVVGLVIPYWPFLRWLGENGFQPSLLVQQMFANRISTFFVLDVLISAVVLLRFAAREGRRLDMKNRWLILLSVLFVGVSLGLPLFLYMRERRLEQNASA
jgi:Protein of unknown function DUF2834